MEKNGCSFPNSNCYINFKLNMCGIYYIEVELIIICYLRTDGWEKRVLN